MVYTLVDLISVGFWYCCFSLSQKPLPFNHAHHNKWAHHVFTSGLRKFFDAVLLVRGHGHVGTISTTVAFLLCQS